MSKEQAYTLWQQAAALTKNLSARLTDKRLYREKHLRYWRLFQRASARQARRWNIYKQTRGA